MINFVVGEFTLTFPQNAKYEIFNDPANYYGIIFDYCGKRYQVLECMLGTRMIINGEEGECRDMPFHLGTAHFLPDFIRCVKQ